MFGEEAWLAIKPNSAVQSELDGCLADIPIFEQLSRRALQDEP